MQESTLFDEFDAVSAKAWKQKIQYALKGADYNERLVWESPEGIKVKPFYHADDAKNPLIGMDSRAREWKIGELNFVGDASKSNQKAHHLLQAGTESLIFILPSEDINLKKLFQGIDLTAFPIHFDPQFLSEGFSKEVQASLDGAGTNIHLHLDPIGHLARTGNWYFNMERDFSLLEAILAQNRSNTLGSIISVDTGLYQNAGANMVQQLAYALGHANEYLNRYAAIPLQGITFKVAIGGNYFFEIAKLKALRLLWSSLAKEYGIRTDCHILAMPSKRNKTVYAYNTNMLRSTTECMSAILGGADTVCNMPYDALYHKNNEFGDRIARNQLLLLKHESFFNGEHDPTEGSYYLDEITRQLSQKALELFKTIEADGGFPKQLKAHTIQRKIQESADKEQLRFDKKEDVLVGTNQYVHEGERMEDSLELYPFVKTKARKTLIVPIIPRRLAETLEQKRLEEEG